MVGFCAFSSKMILKISLPFLVLACFLTTNLASPSTRLRRYAIEDKSPFKEAGESFKQLANEFEKTFKRLTQDTEFIYKNLVSIVKSGFEEGFKGVTTWFLDFILRVEFLFMADGSHYIFPVSGKQETEQQYKAVAIAVSKLLMNLKTMERTDKVVTNVTKNLVSKDIGLLNFNDHQKHPEKMLRTFLHEYFESLDHHMETDEVLGDEYKEKLTEARETVKKDPKMRGPLIKVGEKNHDFKGMEEVIASFKDKKTFLRAIGNKMFLKQSVKHLTMVFSSMEHKHYVLARALIQTAVASPSSESKVNEVYQRALDKAGEAAMNSSESDTEEVLFGSLFKELESDPALYGEVKVSMKEVEKNTFYGTDMLYVDFNLL